MDYWGLKRVSGWFSYILHIGYKANRNSKNVCRQFSQCFVHKPESNCKITCYSLLFLQPWRHMWYHHHHLKYHDGPLIMPFNNGNLTVIEYLINSVSVYKYLIIWVLTCLVYYFEELLKMCHTSLTFTQFIFFCLSYISFLSLCIFVKYWFTCKIFHFLSNLILQSHITILINIIPVFSTHICHSKFCIV